MKQVWQRFITLRHHKLVIAAVLLMICWGANQLLSSTSSTEPSHPAPVAHYPAPSPSSDPNEADSEAPPEPEVVAGPTITVPGSGDGPQVYGAESNSEGLHELVINDQFALLNIDWATAGTVWGPLLTSADATLNITDPKTGAQTTRVVVIEFSNLRNCGTEYGAYKTLKIYSAKRVNGYVAYAPPYGTPLLVVPNQAPGCWPGKPPSLQIHSSIAAS